MDRIACVTVAVAVSIGVYWDAMGCGFVFDDHLAIENNADTDPSKTGWVEILQNDFWGKNLARPDSNKSYRPVTVASFRLNNWFSDKAAYFHLTNVVLHCIAVILVGMLSHSLSHSAFHLLSSSLIFAVHPIHAEAVTGIVGRAEVLCAIFSISAYLVADTKHVSFLRCGIFVFCTVLSVFSKEIGITIPILILISDITSRGFRSIPSTRKVLLAATTIGGYIIFRLLHIGKVDLAGSRLLRKVENPILFEEDMWVRCMSLLHIQYLYIKMMFWPGDMCCEYPFNSIPLVVSPTDIRFLIAIATLTTMLMIALYALLTKHRLLVLALCWAFVPLIPSSGILVTIGTVLADRLVYIPSVGATVLLGWLLTPKEPIKLSLVSAVKILSLLLLCSHWSLMLSERNLDWVSDITLLKSATEICPNGAKHHQQYGILLLNKNESLKAIPYFQRALEIDPDWCEPNLYIGKAIAGIKGPSGYEECQNWWRQCVSCQFLGDECFRLWYEVQKSFLERNDVHNATAHHDLGIVFDEMNQSIHAVSSFRQSGLMRHQDEDWEGAAHSFESALKSWERAPTEDRDESDDLIHPCNIYYWLATCYLKMLRDKSALSTFQLMLRCTDKSRERSFMAAVEGSLQILRRASESKKVLSRLHLTEPKLWLLHAETLIAIANEKKTFPNLESIADTYYTASGSLYLRLASGDPSNCNFLSRSVKAFANATSPDYSENYCTALLLHVRAGCRGNTLDRCVKCSGDAGDECRAIKKKKPSRDRKRKQS